MTTPRQLALDGRQASFADYDDLAWRGIRIVLPCPSRLSRWIVARYRVASCHRHCPDCERQRVDAA